MVQPQMVPPQMVQPLFLPHGTLRVPDTVNTTGYVPVQAWGWLPNSSLHNQCNACGLTTYGKKKITGHMLLFLFQSLRDLCFCLFLFQVEPGNISIRS
jgi:hypothetical protein